MIAVSLGAKFKKVKVIRKGGKELFRKNVTIFDLKREKDRNNKRHFDLIQITPRTSLYFEK